MKQPDNVFPPGWNEDRVPAVLGHYEAQTEEEAVAEDEAADEARQVADSAAGAECLANSS
jgi:hypothetical protein